MGGRTLVFLELGDGSIEEKGRLELEHDIACLDVTPVGEDLCIACRSALHLSTA